jgi:hypothetical protein
MTSWFTLIAWSENRNREMVILFHIRGIPSFNPIPDFRNPEVFLGFPVYFHATADMATKQHRNRQRLDRFMSLSTKQ